MQPFLHKQGKRSLHIEFRESQAISTCNTDVYNNHIVTHAQLVNSVSKKQNLAGDHPSLLNYRLQIESFCTWKGLSAYSKASTYRAGRRSHCALWRPFLEQLYFMMRVWRPQITQLLDSALINNSNHKNERALHFHQTEINISDKQHVWFVWGKFQDRYPLGTTATLRFCGFTEIRQANFRIVLWKRRGLLSSWPSPFHRELLYARMFRL
jgi:hypothetical protein